MSHLQRACLIAIALIAVSLASLKLYVSGFDAGKREAESHRAAVDFHDREHVSMSYMRPMDCPQKVDKEALQVLCIRASGGILVQGWTFEAPAGHEGPGILWRSKP